MSLVYEARDSRTGERVALKVLRAEHRLRPDLVARFVNEAVPIRGLTHPGLPRILACEVPEDGAPYILMEYLGGPLAQRPEEALPLAAALSIGAQLAEALAAVHAHGIVHRDVKPHNVLFVPPAQDGRVKLVDFGLAKRPAAASPLSSLPVSTAPDDRFGTPEYMAPEQFLDAKGVEGSADVYSLGVLLYEMCSGVLPFCAESEGRLKLLHVMAPPPPLPGPALPAGLWPLCSAMLHKDRSQRPAASTVARDLSRLGRELP